MPSTIKQKNARHHQGSAERLPQTTPTGPRTLTAVISAVRGPAGSSFLCIQHKWERRCYNNKTLKSGVREALLPAPSKTLWRFLKGVQAAWRYMSFFWTTPVNKSSPKEMEPNDLAYPCSSCGYIMKFLQHWIDESWGRAGNPRRWLIVGHRTLRIWWHI